jgi:uncharacterized RDD family membrane protein YckC
MENSTLDQDFIGKSPGRPVRYADFGKRTGAALVDFVVLALPIGLNMYNMFSWKSLPLMLLLTLISMVYKPYMEWKYGQTFGKMAANIAVTDLEFGMPSLKAILLRNSLHLASAVLNLIGSVMVFSAPGFEELGTFQEISLFTRTNNPLSSYANIPAGAVFLGYFAMFGSQIKQCFHDMIGRTVVIER